MPPHMHMCTYNPPTYIHLCIMAYLGILIHNYTFIITHIINMLDLWNLQFCFWKDYCNCLKSNLVFPESICQKGVKWSVFIVDGLIGIHFVLCAYKILAARYLVCSSELTCLGLLETHGFSIEGEHMWSWSCMSKSVKSWQYVIQAWQPLGW